MRSRGSPRASAIRSTWWLFFIVIVCINQSDDDEKAIQVQLMGTIYSKANKVIVWLGPWSSGPDMAMESIVWLDDRVKMMGKKVIEETQELSEVIDKTHELEGLGNPYRRSPLAGHCRTFGSLLVQTVMDNERGLPGTLLRPSLWTKNRPMGRSRFSDHSDRKSRLLIHDSRG
jgi:hypothetical protein